MVRSGLVISRHPLATRANATIEPDFSAFMSSERDEQPPVSELLFGNCCVNYSGKDTIRPERKRPGRGTRRRLYGRYLEARLAKPPVNVGEFSAKTRSFPSLDAVDLLG